MAFCPKCGAEVDGAFCGSCGAPVGGSAPPGGQGAPPAQPVPAGGAQAAGLDDNLASLLCYLGGAITGIIFLVLAPYNQKKIIRFNAFQSIFIVLSIFVVMICWGVLTMVVSLIIGGFLGGLFGLLGTLLYLGFFALWIYMMVSAYQGKKVVLPIIGPLAEKQA